MATRVVEGKKPYTGGQAIDIDENKVISLRLRDENNLIIYDEGDDEIYVDLQLDDEITPVSAFPVGVNTGRVIVDNGWDKTGTIIVAKTTSGDNIKLLYADDGTLWMDNGTGTFKQIYFKSDVDALLLALRQYIDEQLALKQDVLTAGDNISIVNNVISAEIPAMAKFLSVWDSSLGEPTTQPGTLPYEYYTGDYYLVENVDSTTNYRPSGTEYDGTASTTVETSPIADGDTYIYDGINWILQSNTQPTVSFSQIAGQPSDNTNLATALGDKQDTLVSGTNIKTVNSISLLGTGDVTVQETLVSGTNIKTINSTSLLGSGDITISAPTYTAGSHIDITNDVISTTGLQEELTVGTNITIEDKYSTESDMKGPCPSGFHVPTKTEWQTVCGILVTTFSLPATNAMVETYLKLPQCGYRGKPNYVNSNTSYPSCTITSIGGTAFTLALKYDGTINYNNGNVIATYGYPIRAFRNTSIIPDNSWTVLYDGSSIASGAGVFHNATLGLISVSGDGTTWTTISDKNVGATNVYNTGDAKSQSNCGKFFQWGNNYGFPFTGSVTTSNTQVDASNYGPGNYYYSSTFITGTSGNKWDSSYNANLRGGVTQGTFQELVASNVISSICAPVVSSTTPSNPTVGLFWYNDQNMELKIYDGTQWVTLATGTLPI